MRITYIIAFCITLLFACGEETEKDLPQDPSRADTSDWIKIEMEIQTYGASQQMNKYHTRKYYFHDAIHLKGVPVGEAKTKYVGLFFHENDQIPRYGYEPNGGDLHIYLPRGVFGNYYLHLQTAKKPLTFAMERHPQDTSLFHFEIRTTEPVKLPDPFTPMRQVEPSN